MDCQTILQNEFHEKYLLEQLSEEEQSEYERHLSQCKSCQQELDDQRLLIAGIRAMGREQMKVEIRQQVQGQRAGETVSFDWARLAKIAAVLFMFVMIPSVFYYYQKTDSASLQPLAPELEDIRMVPEDGVATSGEKKVRQAEQPEKIHQKPARSEKMEPAASEAVSGSQKSEAVAPQPQMEESVEALAVSAESQKTTREISDSESPESSAAAASELSEPASVPSAEEKEGAIKQYRTLQSSLYEMAITPEDQEPIQPRLNKAVPDEQRRLQLEKAPLERSGKVETTDAKNSGQTEQERFDSFESMSPQRLHFTSGGRDVVVYIIEPTDKQAKQDGRKFPQSFPVRITRRDSSYLEMVLELDLPFAKMDPDELHVEILPSQTVRVVFEEARVSYRVDLKADSTRAIRRNSNAPK